MAIGCEVLAPGTVCSSNGICLQDANNNSYCQCTVAGFSTMGDTRFQSGLDCDVHIPTITAMWWLILIISLMSSTVPLYALARSIRKLGSVWKLTSRIINIIYLTSAPICILFTTMSAWRLRAPRSVFILGRRISGC
jgi:hypothetical protein